MPFIVPYRKSEEEIALEYMQKQVDKKKEENLVHRLLDENRELREKYENERTMFYKTMRLYEDEIQTLERKIQSYLRTFSSMEIVHIDGTVHKLDLNGNIIDEYTIDSNEIGDHINEKEEELFILVDGNSSLAFKSMEELDTYRIQHNLCSARVMYSTLMR